MRQSILVFNTKYACALYALLFNKHKTFIRREMHWHQQNARYDGVAIAADNATGLCRSGVGFRGFTPGSAELHHCH